MLPLMNLVGYKIQVKTCIFLAFSGLRGAVGLSLALILTVNEKIDKKVSNEILFYVSGMVVLTLFINGMTAGFVLRKLGLATESPLAKKLMFEFLEDMDA
jgi:NhaP-type Na+/H+ or K+/H+ antiporter